MRDVSVHVPMLVQPGSEQACLLDMNALPLLGIALVHNDGKLVYPPKPSLLEPCPHLKC